jgi:hypothetical protein
MVYNSTNNNKTKNHLSPSITGHKKEMHRFASIQKDHILSQKFITKT